MSRQDYKLETIASAVSHAAGTATSSHENQRMNAFSAMLTIANDNPATKNFADTDITTTGDYIAITSHGYKTGLLATLTTTGGLPTGLANNVNYYVSVVDSGKIGLSTSRANAANAVLITLAKDGNGTHSVKPTAIAGLDVHLEASIDGTTWVDLVNSTAAAAGSTITSWTGISYPYVRAESTLTAGQISLTAIIRSVGEV